MSDTYMKSAHSAREIHHETSTSSIVEPISEIPDYDQVFEWLVEDSWAFICNYDREVVKRSCKKGSTKTAIPGTSQKVRSKKPYKYHKRSTTSVVLGDKIEIAISWFPTPICSCTGTPRECYPWGKGGWVSACCTSTLSTFPLPSDLSISRNSRMIGRKMGPSTYRKVIKEMYVKGHDFCNSIDLKDHWAKRGTNQFIVLR